MNTDSRHRARGVGHAGISSSETLVACLLAIAASSCGKVGLTPEFQPACRQGETRACDCPGGSLGVQTCAFDGSGGRWDACGQCGASDVDAGTPDAGGVCSGKSLPAFSATCGGCHEIAALGNAQSDEDSGPKEWTGMKGPGLLRHDPALVTAAIQLRAPWTSRGRHALEELDPAACGGCHPLREDGLGHGTKTYPAAYRRTPFEGGVNCAGTCHAWLKDTIVATGFEDAKGNTRAYRGSGRPEALLSIGSKHAEIWKAGLRSTSPWIKIGALRPGCGGCHHAQSEKHGEVPDCMTCHRFGGVDGEPHKAHVDRVAARMDAIDPGRPQMTECGYCHIEGGTTAARSNAVCYNCHLSGHQPLNAAGNAHFWPAAE